MNIKIIQHKQFKNKHGSTINNYKIFYEGNGLWISDIDFKDFAELLKFNQEKSIALNTENADLKQIPIYDMFVDLKEPISENYSIIKRKSIKGEFHVLIPKTNSNLLNEPEIAYGIKTMEISPSLFVKPIEMNNLTELKNENSPKFLYKTTEKPIALDNSKNKESENSKLIFINNLLSYSVKKKIDDNTRARLFKLIGREVENSSELNAVIARIEKLENELKLSTHLSVEDKFEIDLSEHNPLNLVNLIDKFRDSNGIKYLTHKFEVPGQIFYREEILRIAKKEFWDFVKIRPISRNFYKNFIVFGWGIYVYKDSNGDEKKITKRIFNGREYSTNWMSLEIDKWCKENPGMHPIEKFEMDLINPFQLTYKIENGILKDYIIERLAKALGNSYGNFEIDIVDCEKANFKTDVDSLLTGISGILNSIKQREMQSKKIKIVFERKGRTRFIKIIHIGSKSDKSFEEEEKFLLQGDLLSVKSSFYRVCDWSILSDNPSSKVNKINILYDIKIKESKEFTTETIEGFSHVLTFYS